MGKAGKRKRSFILYYDMITVVEKLSVEDRADLWFAVLSTGGVCACPALSPVAEMAFLPIKNNIARDAEKWEKTCKARAEAGRKGGIRSGQSRSKTKQSQANEADTDTDTVTDTVTVTETDTVTDTDTVTGHHHPTLIESGDCKHCAAGAARRAGPSPSSAPEGSVSAEVAAHFEALWALYPHKRGKSAVSAATRRQLYGVSKAAMQQAIRRYEAEVVADDRKWLNGSTWFNGRYLDYLGDAYTPPPQRPGGRSGSPQSSRYVSGEGFRDFNDMVE